MELQIKHWVNELEEAGHEDPDVVLTCNAGLVDASFSYSYGSINGVEPRQEWEMESIEWNKDLYTTEENEMIQGSIDSHEALLSGQFFKKYLLECEN